MLFRSPHTTPPPPCPTPGLPLRCSCSSAEAQGKSKPWAWSHEDCSPASPASPRCALPRTCSRCRSRCRLSRVSPAAIPGCPCPSSPCLGLLPLFSCRPCLALGLGMDPEPLEDTLARWPVTDCLLPAYAGPPVQASTYPHQKRGARA